VTGSGRSIRGAIGAINDAGLTQADAIKAITRITTESGRRIGPVVELPGGARGVLGVQQGLGQPIVHVSSSGVTKFGSADITFAVGPKGEFIATVTNLILP